MDLEKAIALMGLVATASGYIAIADGSAGPSARPSSERLDPACPCVAAVDVDKIETVDRFDLETYRNF